MNPELDTAAAQTEAIQDQPELTERELDAVTGGLTVGSAPATGPKPAVDTF